MTNELSAADAARAALAVAAGAPPMAVVTSVTPDGEVRRMLVSRTGTQGTLGSALLDEAALRHARNALAHAGATEPTVEAVTLPDGSWLLYIETHRPSEHLVVVGAGHIAVPLAHLGVLLGFRVTVLDDREEYATTERFDEDVVVRRVDFEADPFAGVPLDGGSYVALVTRGHRWDFDCLRRLLQREERPRYIGMIGSRRRVRAAFGALLDAGVSRGELAAVHAPIGLELKAETPAEIAVAIAAELIAARRGAPAAGLVERERVLDRLLKES
jgi:xanthine dehydrogenase accessory factor